MARGAVSHSATGFCAKARCSASLAGVAARSRRPACGHGRQIDHDHQALARYSGGVIPAALYHRVSTVDQNPKAARRELRAAAKRLGLHVVLDVEETGSGANNDRPGLVQVLRAAQRGTISAVVVWKLDRFGRSALDLLGNIRQLEAAGVRFLSLTQGIDIHPGGDSMSRLLLTMLSAIGEFERDLIVERTRLGLANARRAGKQLGRPRVQRPAAATVRRLKREGATWPEIATQLRCTVWAARMAVKKGARKPPHRAQ